MSVRHGYLAAPAQLASLVLRQIIAVAIKCRMNVVICGIERNNDSPAPGCLVISLRQPLGQILILPSDFEVLRLFQRSGCASRGTTRVRKQFLRTAVVRADLPHAPRGRANLAEGQDSHQRGAVPGDAWPSWRPLLGQARQPPLSARCTEHGRT